MVKFKLVNYESKHNSPESTEIFSRDNGSVALLSGLGQVSSSIVIGLQQEQSVTIPHATKLNATRVQKQEVLSTRTLGNDF